MSSERYVTRARVNLVQALRSAHTLLSALLDDHVHSRTLPAITANEEYMHDRITALLHALLFGFVDAHVVKRKAIADIDVASLTCHVTTDREKMDVTVDTLDATSSRLFTCCDGDGCTIAVAMRAMIVTRLITDGYLSEMPVIYECIQQVLHIWPRSDELSDTVLLKALDKTWRDRGIFVYVYASCRAEADTYECHLTSKLLASCCEILTALHVDVTLYRRIVLSCRNVLDFSRLTLWIVAYAKRSRGSGIRMQRSQSEQLD